MHRIHADFDYDHTATTVTSTVAEVLATRAGVCQDFAHLDAGLPAQPRPGRPLRQRLPRDRAARPARSASSAPTPRTPGSRSGCPARAGGTDGDWLAVDPTNDQRVDDRYVTVAWGRDYADVPPVKGVIFTEAKESTLQVSVDVAPLR